MIIKSAALGEPNSFRKFKDLNELLIYIEELQKQKAFLPTSEFASPNGIMKQFLAFGLQKEFVEKDEVMINFLEEDPTYIGEKFKLSTIWFNTKTRKSIEKAPEWFNKYKREILLDKLN